MKFFKSHVTFTKEQRRGIFLLLLVIIVLQCLYYFACPVFNKNTTDAIEFNSRTLETFIAEIDSLKSIELEARKPKVFPFNPNYITDYKGAQLGMSNAEIDRLLRYRKQGQWINSTKQFQEVTQVSDSLLQTMSPYFKFPEWVTNPKPVKSTFNNGNKTTKKSFQQKGDLNKATAKQLEQVHGIGKVLSERIVKFRNKFKGGFIADIQLKDVYGLTPEVIENITLDFTVKTPRKIQKINLNTATIEQLVTVQHIDYNLAHHIIEHRTLHTRFTSISELLKVKDFPVNKLEIIKLYLQIDNEN